jgi:hypothetical protein
MWLYYREPMYTPFPTLRKNCFSEMVIGGDITADIGIGRNTTITDGPIIAVIHHGIKEYLTIGGFDTEIIGGAVMAGIRAVSITAVSTIIGVAVIGAPITDGIVPAAVKVDTAAVKADAPIPMGR